MTFVGSASETFVTVDGRRILHFGDHGFLGLERDIRLRTGAQSAMMRFGVQYSAPRSSSSIDLYAHLEGLLEQVFAGPTIVTPSAAQTHVAALPALVRPRDLVVVDQGSNDALHTATEVLSARGLAVQIVPHNDPAALERVMVERASKFANVWFLTDGLFAVHGDYAPVQALEALREEYPKLHLYFDDSYGMTIRGRHGRGFVLSLLGSRERTVVATSLGTSFACGGGAIVLPDQEMRRRVFRCGLSRGLDTPLAPPVLGAAIASARIHLTEEVMSRQQRLAALIHARNELFDRHGLQTPVKSVSPIAFVDIGDEKKAERVAASMKARGFLVTAVWFPRVPIGRAGIVFSTTVNTSPRSLDTMLGALAEEIVPRIPRTPSPPSPARGAFFRM